MEEIKLLADKIKHGDRTALSRGITLCESDLALHKSQALFLLDQLYPVTGNSIRIGVSGIPGAGKSTLIEALGTYLIDQHQKRVAVLTIDPSSQQSSGSILGDKTRMETLSRKEAAFIRPSPTKTQLGGVAQQTQTAILLCEAAAYDIIIVETVGIGQSEIAVNHMVDVSLLLQIVGAGDDIQAMKRGVLEWADMVIFNKADQGKEIQAKLEATNMSKALALFPTKHTGWSIPVLTCSALEKTGIESIWETIISHQLHLHQKKIFQDQREDQLNNLLGSLEDQVLQSFLAEHKKINSLRKENQQEWQAKERPPFTVLQAFKKQLTKILTEDN
ncbi:MAG: methylmalonyl Co-A mutase-associated GTPase MeaB [Flavobacteriaceae bacterium]